MKQHPLTLESQSSFIRPTRPGRVGSSTLQARGKQRGLKRTGRAVADQNRPRVSGLRMLSIDEQVSKGILVCPQTRARLNRRGNVLVSEYGATYTVTSRGVPILLTNPTKAEEYSHQSAKMNQEHSEEGVRERQSLLGRLKLFLDKDYRTKASCDAFDSVIKEASADSLCLSIGGGPTRPDPKLVNLNIWPFPNVDMVADAHQLPYACSSVDAIYCEAVLEHLTRPLLAVEEMFRVMRPGGRVIAITPFMQTFHGYPNHFQNFTRTGHALIFSTVGFKVLESGTCVGPVFTLFDIGNVFLREYLPKIASLPLRVAWKLLGACVVPMDLLLSGRESGCVMASTTFVVAEKST